MNDSRLFLKTKPWEKDRYETTKSCKMRYPRGNVTECRVVYDTDIDYSKTYWKLGDIVQFGTSYHDYEVRYSWRQWYLTEKDLQKYIKENCPRRYHTPLYAQNQYAIILSRYKLTKYKWHGKFRDYGTVIMMLSGSHIGHIRRYFVCRPWNKIDTYPYQYDQTELLQGTTVGTDVKNFLERLMRKFGNENQ
jgi:hypothetical protein